MAGLVPAIHVLTLLHPKTWMPGTSPGMTKIEWCVVIGAYAVAMSGKTASILVFSVAALNGLTM